METRHQVRCGSYQVAEFPPKNRGELRAPIGDYKTPRGAHGGKPRAELEARPSLWPRAAFGKERSEPFDKSVYNSEYN